MDTVTQQAAEMFDIKFDGTTQTTLRRPHPLPARYTCGLIVGPSGSGKTSLLRALCARLLQPGRGKYSARDAAAYARWARRRGAQVISVAADQHRIDLVSQLQSGMGVDEFTSDLDRLAAYATAAAVRRHLRQHGHRGVVFATVHDDIIPFLQPDWVWYTQTQQLLPAARVPKYAVHNIALRDSNATHWLPQQELQTSALRGGGKLPLGNVTARTRLPSSPLPAPAHEEESAVSALAPSQTRVLHVVVTPCSAKEARTLMLRDLGFASAPRLQEPYRVATLEGCAAAVLSGSQVYVAPRLHGLNLEPHIRAAAAPLKARGALRGGGAAPGAAASAVSLVPSLAAGGAGAGAARASPPAASVAALS